MTPDGMTSERAREVMAEHEPHDEGCTLTWPPKGETCLPYTLAAAYVAACTERDQAFEDRDREQIRYGKVRAERDQARAQVEILGRSSQRVSTAITGAADELARLRAELATAQGRIDAALAIVEGSDHSEDCYADECVCPLTATRAALTGDPQ